MEINISPEYNNIEVTVLPEYINIEISASVIANDISASNAIRAENAATASEASATVSTTQAGIATEKAIEADQSATTATTAAGTAITAKTDAETARDIAIEEAEHTALDRIATGEDRTATGLDRVQTGLDRVQTGEDVIATGEDRIATGLDVIAANEAKDIAIEKAGEAEISASIAAQVGTSTPLTGFTVGANAPILPSDTILSGFGKAQGQLNNKVGGTIASGQVAIGTGSGVVGGDSGLVWDSVNARLGVSNVGIAPTSTIHGANGFSLTSAVIEITNTNASLNSAAILRLDYTVGYGNARGTEIRSVAKRAASTNGRSRDVEFWTDNDGTLIQLGVWKFNGLFGILTDTPTNTLDVNGTARIRTRANATGNFATYSAVGVLQERTALESSNDILKAISGYNATVAQRLEHTNTGTINWVNI